MKILNYQLLGGSGLRVSEVCLGAMTFGEDWGWGSSKEARFNLDHLKKFFPTDEAQLQTIRETVAIAEWRAARRY